MRKDEYERIFTELEKIAVVQSVKSSNAIERIVTSNERIEEIVNQNSKPLGSKEIPKAIEQLILAYHDASNNSNINQLLLIPCFTLDFLCIHPFRDGNRRMSRLLTLLLLYKNEFDVGKYVLF